MNAFKRNLVLLVLVTTMLACLVVIGWKFSEQAAQRQRNRALIAAIKTDRINEAIRLLANGADANARDIPLDARTLWQKVREMFQRPDGGGGESLSALTLALRREMADSDPPPPQMSFQLIKALHDAGAKEEGRFAPPQADVQTAEQKMENDSDSPLALPRPAQNLSEIDDALTTFLRQRGMSARAMADLAKCRFRDANYTDAVYAYRIAAPWQSTDAGLQTCLAQAEEYARIAAEIGRTLPAFQRVFLVRPYPSEAHPAAWIALYASKEKYTTDAAQMGFYQSNGAGLRQICHTPVSRNALYEYGPITQGRLRVFPLTGRAAPEILLACQFQSSWKDGVYLDVFACAGGRLANIASVSSNDTIDIEKAPHGDGYIIRRACFTGMTRFNEELPKRSDYYAFNGQRFAFAAAQFIDSYRPYIKAAERLLRRYPADYDLLQNLGSLYSLTGRPQKSARYYREAERLCRKAITQAGTRDCSDARAILAQIVARDPEGQF